MTDLIDGYELNEDGTAEFAFEGVFRKLKRPTLGQYKAILEALADLRGDILKRQRELEGLEGEELEAKKRELAETVDLSEQINVFLGWLDVVFATLAGEGLPRTTITVEDPTGETPPAEKSVFDDTKLPVWITNALVITDLVQHWQTVPSRRGGQ